MEREPKEAPTRDERFTERVDAEVFGAGYRSGVRDVMRVLQSVAVFLAAIAVIKFIKDGLK